MRVFDCVGSRMLAERKLPHPSILLLVRPVLATLSHCPSSVAVFLCSAFANVRLSNVVGV